MKRKCPAQGRAFPCSVRLKSVACDDRAPRIKPMDVIVDKKISGKLVSRKLVRVLVFEIAKAGCTARRPQRLDEVLVERRADEIVVQRLKLHRPVRQEHPFETAPEGITGL